jgi:peptidoglycan/xylan/chitin deacetylase (PgdA/CDA1 family)
MYRITPEITIAMMTECSAKFGILRFHGFVVKLLRHDHFTVASMSLKRNVRNNIAQLLYSTGVTLPGRRACGRFSIITFHRVLRETERQAFPFPGLAVTPQELDSFLAYFARHFDCGPLATQHERYLNGEATARPLLAVTFDDGQYDNYYNARPVLARHGVKASFFIPVEAVERQELLWHDRLGYSIFALLKTVEGRAKLKQILDSAGLSVGNSSNPAENIAIASKRLLLQARLGLVENLVTASGSTRPPEFARIMSYGEIAKLASDGHEIGSHSLTHCMMTECNDHALVHELVESRSILQTRLGLPIESFCYPNGNSDTRTAHAVAKAGYRRAVTTTWGNNGQRGDRFQLRRYNMDARHVQDSSGKLMPAVLAFRMSGFHPGL